VTEHSTKDPWRADESFSLVVPVFCEAQRLQLYIDELLEFIGKQPNGSELIFVDDGSTDETCAVLEGLLAAHADAPARLLRRPHRGKGAAVRAGLESARGAIAGFCYLDLSTSLRDLETLVDIARDEPVLAIGSRDMPGSELVRPEGHIREFLGRSYNRVVQFVLIPGVIDTQCGAKLARTEIWRRVLPACAEDGFAWDVEAIAIARGFGIDVREIPVSWRHDPDSKVHVARDGLRMLVALPRISRHVRRMTLHPTGSAATEEVFEGANARDLVEADASHWWFRSKAQFVSTLLRRFSAGAGWLLDIGAGSGGVTAQLGWDARKKLVVEGSTLLAREAADRHRLRALNGRVEALPIADNTVSVVCLLDVLEHLTNPEDALAEAHRVLVHGGHVVVTVPAHPRLWSAADESLGHKRRYTRRLIRAQLTEQGFRPRYASHVFSWLVIPVWAKRRLRPGGGPESGLDVASPLVDRSASFLTMLENALVGRLRLPVGTTILAVAERP
jgi:dolichyl-phosphate beta-glucosyltransferase